MVKVNRNLEYATITSPIDGVVINRAVEEGQTVWLPASRFDPVHHRGRPDQDAGDSRRDEADIGNVENGQRVPSPSTPIRTTYSKVRSCKLPRRQRKHQQLFFHLDLDGRYLRSGDIGR